MNQITSIRLCGLVLLATFLLADSTPLQIHTLRRIRREPEPEPASSSTPSSSSSHDSHEVKCDEDTSSLKKSCPNNDTCPMDDATVEKCCHCLSVCCGKEAGSSSEEGGMDMKNGTMNESAEGGKGKDIGGKMKDALNSAEGWLKNTGQNIKSGFEKASDNAKQAASDMKDKVRQGINNVATKVKNATDDKPDCKGKGALTTTPHNAEVIDSKCTTDMDMSKSGDGEKDNMSGSTESSSMGMSMNDTTTHVPGFKKSKREAGPAADALLSSSTSLETSYSSSGSRDDSMDRDSTEVSWTKSTTTKTKDSGRHRREQSNNNGGSSSTDVPSSTTQQSRNKRAAAEMSTEMPGSTMSPQSQSNGRNKREATNSSSESMSSTENSSLNGGNHRNKRAAGTATDNPDAGTVSSTPTNPKAGRDRRAASLSKGETTTMSPDSPSTLSPSSEDEADEEADDEDDEEATTTEPSTTRMKGNRPKNTSVGVSLRVNDTNNAKRRINSGNIYFPISPGSSGGGSILMDSQDEGDYYGDGMDRPPTIIFPGGGVIAAPGIGIKKGSGVPDLSYYPPQASTSLSVESSLSGSFQKGNHHLGTGSIGGSVFGGGSGRGPISSSMKPGYCQSLATGSANCIVLQSRSRSEQCSFDADCSGIKKCCFYTCDVYKQIGVCEVPTLTRAKLGY